MTDTPTKARVLAIDDDSLVRTVINVILRSSFNVTVVDGGGAAIELFERGSNFEAILLDLTMPSITGIDVVEWMKERRPELLERTGILTAGPTCPETDTFLRTTTCPVMLKPFTADELTEFVQRLVAGC